MKKKIRNILRSTLKNLIYIRFKRMNIFADKLNVTSPYLSRAINSEKTYIYTLIEYLLMCDTKINITIHDNIANDNIFLSLSSVEEIANQIGFICRQKIRQKHRTVEGFAIATNRRKTDLYTILGAKNKASIDKCVDLLEELGFNIEFGYELI